MGASYIDFYLGANTPNGFVSRFDQISESDKLNKVYVIKGGPGTGKSSLMKKVGKSFFDMGEEVERVHCSSDPDSLDSVIVENRKFAILDGTPPHVMEPKYPGAYETIVDLYPCWNEKGLADQIDNIRALNDKCSACHKKACGYLSVASALIKDNMRVSDASTNYIKAKKYAENLADREFGKKEDGEGSEKVRFLSAVTPKGVNVYNFTVETLCDKVYVIEDDIGNVSNCILNVIREKAKRKNLDIISCYCVLSPNDKLEHIFIPKLRLAFLTSNGFHKIEFTKTVKRVKASRFTDLNKLYEKKQYLAFNKRAEKQFIAAAVAIMREAKAYHDQLESYYINNVDFDKVNNLSNTVIEKIKENSIK